MSTFKKLLAGTALVIALAAPAAAQQQIFIPNGSLMIIDADGKAEVITAGKMAHAMMLKHAKVMGKGMIFFMDGGKLYAMSDRKGPNGIDLSMEFRKDTSRN